MISEGTVSKRFIANAHKGVVIGLDRTFVDGPAPAHRDMLQIAVAGGELNQRCRAGIVRVVERQFHQFAGHITRAVEFQDPVFDGASKEGMT